MPWTSHSISGGQKQVLETMERWTNLLMEFCQNSILPFHFQEDLQEMAMPAMGMGYWQSPTTVPYQI